MLLTPLARFTLLYVAAAVKLAFHDTPVSSFEGAPASHETIAVFGASGTAGDGILKAALANTDNRKIHVITRRATPRIEQGVGSVSCK